MTTSRTPVTRPVLVTVLVVFIVLSGISSVITAILIFGIATPAIPAAVFALVVGLIYFAVAKGLLDGNPTARLIVAVVNAIQAVVAIVTLTATDDPTVRSSAVRSLVFAVIILAILFSPSANAFFGNRR